MKTFRLTSNKSRQIDQYGSSGAFLIPIIRQADGLSVVSITIEPHGLLGLHPASADQLLLVFTGEALVSTADQGEVPVKSGMAVLWRQGEEHQTRTGEAGLFAIVIEGEGLAGSIEIPPGRHVDSH